MMIRIFALAVLLPFAANAAPQCAPRASVLAYLAEKYGETRQSIGLSANGAVLEMFANREAGSWTMTATGPAGETCLLASGDGFEIVAEALPPNG